MTFTPITTTLGALLLHLSSTTLLTTTSQILGCSGLLSSLPSPSASTTPTLLGLFASALIPIYPTAYPPAALRTVLTAGALVGFGTKWAKGCTSGHMLLGVPRGSMRSLVATATFFTTAVVTAAISGSPPICEESGACYAAEYPDATAGVVAVVVSAAGAYVIRHLLPRTETSRVITRVYSGFVFGLGLIVSGMAAPAKTLGFLSITDPSRFDPSLTLVAVVGMGGNAVAWWWNRPKDGPLLKEGGGGGWDLPDSTVVDWRLLVGSAVFGVGWGLLGVCPGPGVVAAVRNGGSGLAWVAAFLAGRTLAGCV
jgi:uncharacterized membrane protein YedE/YeeE